MIFVWINSKDTNTIIESQDASQIKRHILICFKMSSEKKRKTFGSDMIRLLEEEVNTDCQFQFTDEMQVIKAHKLILGARSPVLNAMFKADMAENRSNVVTVEDASVDDIFRPTSPDFPMPQMMICAEVLFIDSTALTNSIPSIFSNLSIPSL